MDLVMAAYPVPVLIAGGVVLYLIGIAIGIVYVRSAMEKRRRNASATAPDERSDQRPNTPADEAGAIRLEVAFAAYVVIALAGLILGLITHSPIVLGAAGVSVTVAILGGALILWSKQRARPE